MITAEQKRTFLQLIKFCLVGGSGMVWDMGITALTTELLGFDPRIGAVLGFLVAVVNNYLLNRIWTFQNGKQQAKATSFATFFVICLVGMGISIGVMHLCISYLGMGVATPEELAAANGLMALWVHYRYLVARLCGIAVATLWNFFGSKKIAFKS